jgi:hypothetical protein
MPPISASFLGQRQQIVSLPSICNGLDILDAPVAMDMNPCASELRIAVGAPHRKIAILFDVGNHFLPRAITALGYISRLINPVTPEMADVLMPCASRHPASRTFNCCCHGEALYENASK